MSRRPVEKVTRFLADTPDGLDRLIQENTKGKKVLKIEKQYTSATVLFGRNQARVTTLEDVWSQAT